MDEDVRITVESQDAALAMLREAIDACLESELTPGDVFTEVRPRLIGPDSILIDGPAFEHLSDREARNAIRAGYRILAEGATLSFTDALRNEEEIRELCRQADVPDQNIKVTGEPQSTRVSITKLT